MTRALWTLAEVCAAVGAVCNGDGELAIAGVSIDSRTIAAGDLFIAIQGENSDGHAYVAKAFANGAVAAIVATPAVATPAIADGQRKGDSTRGTLIVVEDTLKALEHLGMAARARTSARIIAITGSVGKTGTKEALRVCLSEQAPTHAAERSFNNHWGVPLTLARMPAQSAYGIFEIGMNHAGEIRPLTKMVRPDVAIVTTVAAGHLGHFASIAEIAGAKAEIFEGLAPGGLAIINRDIAQYGILASAATRFQARIEGFGEAGEAQVRLLQQPSDADGSDVTAHIAGRDISYRVGAPGAHLVMNSLAVLAAVAAVGADLDQAAARLASLAAPDGRGSRTHFQIEGGEVLLIDESYNANPASLSAALAAMTPLPRERFPRRIAVLGDMLELGEHSDELHRGLAEPIQQAGIDRVFACGPHMRQLFEQLAAAQRGGYAEHSAELTPLLLDVIAPGDAIMVKGSHGSRMGSVVEALRTALSARSMTKV